MKLSVILFTNDTKLESFLKNNSQIKLKILQDLNLFKEELKYNIYDIAILDFSKNIFLSDLKDIRNIDSNLKILIRISYIDKYIIQDFFKLKVQNIFFSLEDLNKLINYIFKDVIPKKNINFDFYMGQNEVYQKIRDDIFNVANLRILFIGETGVGKNVWAQFSNQILSRKEGKKRAFEVLNCACLNENNFSDILFGHVKGAYTDAFKDKSGFVELCDNGDLLLDGIDNLSLGCQAMLLNFLDDQSYYKVGTLNKKYSNIRLLFTASENIFFYVKKDLFRKDLFSRISQNIIFIPPLRHIRDEIPNYVGYFINKFSDSKKSIDPKILDLYLKYDWREGNIRELKDACLYMLYNSKKDKNISLSNIKPIYLEEKINVNFFNDHIISFHIDDVFRYGLKQFLNQIKLKIFEHAYYANNKVLNIVIDKLKIGRNHAIELKKIINNMK